MKKILLVVGFVVMVTSITYSQAVQWASKVIAFSSELTPAQYSAAQALGKPNVLPAGGQNPGAWTPDKPKRAEFIKLGYSNPIQIQQIAIAESYNPGALYKVYVYDQSDKEYLVGSFNPQAVPVVAQMRTVFFEKTKYKVTAVKLELDGKVLSDYFSIDAVAISDSRYPIVANIDKPELLASGLTIEHLDDKVNSTASEINPLLSPDGKMLFFSRRNHPDNIGGVNDKEDIWYSELGADGKWTMAKNAGPTINNAYPNFVNAVTQATPDGKAVLLILGNQYHDDGTMSAGVSVSNNISGKWSKPKSLIIKNDYNFNEKANYFLTNTRKALLMSVEREDSHGGRDLCVSFMKSDSTWTEPLNMGNVINTAGDEVSPFLGSDDKTLYFSSNGFSGYGAMDVYMSKRLDDTWSNWSEPENLGPEVNSKLDDMFFNVPTTSEYAYYSRAVTPDNLDIFRVKMPLFKTSQPIVVVKGKLLDAKTGNPIGAKIIYEKLPEGTEVGQTFSNPKTGEYEIKVPGGSQYGIRAEAKDHLSTNQNLDLTNFKNSGSVQEDVRLNPIEIAKIEENVSIALNNVFFDFDKSVLKAESFPELNRIVQLMKEKKKMTVEIAGHTDKIGTEEYNLDLSERRAAAVAKYIIGKGIASDRINIVFFGESKPVDLSETEEAYSKNRRVEFKIIKM
jgi:outer membrane protein OmpA-like peptidoglycan-associated protein